VFNSVQEIVRQFRQKRNMRAISEWNKIEGFTDATAAYALYSFARSLPEGAVCVEIGVWKGRSAYCIARGLKGRSKLIAIDPFDASGEPGSQEIYENTKGARPLDVQFKNAMSRYGVSNRIELKVGYSNEFVGDVGEIDLLFIDGDHSINGATYDYETYAPKIKPGGYLVFDDYDPTRKQLGPTNVIETRVYPSLLFDFVGLRGRLWIGKRRLEPWAIECAF